MFPGKKNFFLMIFPIQYLLEIFPKIYIVDLWCQSAILSLIVGKWKKGEESLQSRKFCCKSQRHWIFCSKLFVASVIVHWVANIIKRCHVCPRRGEEAMLELTGGSSRGNSLYFFPLQRVAKTPGEGGKYHQHEFEP